MTKAVLERRTHFNPTSFLLELSVGNRLPAARAGQFVSVATAPELALPRPFAVAGRPSSGSVELLVESRGRGTRFLAEAPLSSELSVIGPLGNTFTKPRPEARAVLVAGGIGVAGLRLLAWELADSETPWEPLVLVGARSRELLLDGCLAVPDERPRPEVRIATDDGSAGHRGPVTDLLARALDESPGPSTVYCCGPPAMIRSAAGIALERGAPCEALLEEVMACGVGACRGCVVETRAGYRCVCSDGPVFDVSELVFGEPVSV
jgi:dihydroorotate dehydrogenase electron transfer subunit